MILPKKGATREAKSVDVSPLNAGILDATLRLVRAAESAEEYRFMGPLILRELIYRLLTSARAPQMHPLARFGGQDHQMVRAVKILSDHFSKPLRVETLARQLGMNVSGFMPASKPQPICRRYSFRSNFVYRKRSALC